MENRTEELNGVQITPEQFEKQMLETRESLTEKVALLENQVVGSVKSAADTLTETVEAVKSFVTTAPETVKQTVEEVTESVRRSFDVSTYVKDNPWLSVGICAGAGFLAGFLSSRSTYASERTASKSASEHVSQPIASGLSDRVVSASSPEPGILNDLLGIVRGKMKELAETALESASASLRETVKKNIPQFIDQATSNLISQPDNANRIKNNGYAYN